MSDEIACKACGCFDRVTRQGVGPHAYEIVCIGCNKHIKWASRLDIDEQFITKDEIIFKINQNEWAAIKAAKNKNFGLFASCIKKRDKYLERL